MCSFKSIRLSVAVSASALFFSGSLYVNAQVAGGTIQGNISDPTGAVMSNVTVSVRNTGTDIGTSVVSNSHGFYQVPNLIPGDYRIVVSAPGFVTEVRTGLTLTVGAIVLTDIKMALRGLTEKVDVQGTQQGVELATSTVSGTVGSTAVRELPLNARDWTMLSTLEPGVLTTRTQTGLNAGKGQRGFGTQLTISGGRPQQNNYRLDGISINDYSNGAPGSVVGVDLGVDAVEEFSVLTSNYPAEYGRSSGGVINAVTRSGTNNVHGDAYEFLRNSAFDARNFFDLTHQPPSFKRNQFGAAAGGPIKKNRAFIFGDYEGLRQGLGVTRVDFVPSIAARSGQLCNAPDCSTSNTIPVDRGVSKFINAFYPLPNGPLLCPFTSCVPGTGDTGTFTFAGQQITNENYGTTKVDHKLSDTDSLAGTYVFDDAGINQPDELNNKQTGFNSRRQVATLEETKIFSPRFVNAVRFGYSRVVANIGLTSLAGNPASGDASFGTVPGHAAADVSVPGITEFTGGLGSLSTYHFHWNSLQAYDDAFVTHGLHSTKFGISIERIRSNQVAFTDPNGVFVFNSLPEFLQNTGFGPESVGPTLTATIPNTITERGFRQTIFGVYVQDDWRVRPNLTLNLGLRYEMATVPTEVQGKLSNLRNLGDATPHLGNPLFSNPTLRNFEPRVGFSWDPFKDGKTAVRAGAGLFDVLPLPYELELLEAFSAPFVQIGVGTSLPPGSFPSAGYAAISASPTTLRYTYIESHPKRNYVAQWNLNIQRELAPNLTLLIGYVGSHGVHQPFRVEDADIVLPAATPAGYLWPSPRGSGIRLNQNVGQIGALFWQGNSSYQALEVKLQKHMSHGVDIGGSYTWGKSIDNSSASVVGDAFTNAVSSLPWFDTRRSKGLSDFDVRHNAVIHYTWEVPNPKWSGFTGWLASGYELGGIFEISTGTPFTVGFGGDALGLNSTDPTLDVPSVLRGKSCNGALTNPGSVTYVKTECLVVAPVTPAIAARCVAVPNADGSTGCLNLLGNLGRNSLIGPGLINLDFSLFKNNKIRRISEDFNIQFRAELFNVLNHTNFAAPTDNLAVFDGSGAPVAGAGQLTSTVTPSRQIQFAVKFIW